MTERRLFQLQRKSRQELLTAMQYSLIIGDAAVKGELLREIRFLPFTVML